MDDEARYNRAKKRAEELRGFYHHMLAYFAVNAFLFIVNLVTSPGSWWFFWPLIGWGIGLAIHGLTVIGSGHLWGKEWEERKIRELMEKDKGGGSQ